MPAAGWGCCHPNLGSCLDHSNELLPPTALEFIVCHEVGQDHRCATPDPQAPLQCAKRRMRHPVLGQAAVSGSLPFPIPVARSEFATPQDKGHLLVECDEYVNAELSCTTLYLRWSLMRSNRPWKRERRSGAKVRSDRSLHGIAPSLRKIRPHARICGCRKQHSGMSSGAVEGPESQSQQLLRDGRDRLFAAEEGRGEPLPPVRPAQTRTPLPPPELPPTVPSDRAGWRGEGHGGP